MALIDYLRRLKLIFFALLLISLISASLIFKLSSTRAATSICEGGLCLESIYEGTIIRQDNQYEYAPSIMKDGDSYKIWWCGTGSGYLGPGDNIFYATSTDGYQWSNIQTVLQTTGGREGRHACDPSVVKVNDRYYLYYTSDSSDTDGRNNSIFLATSNDGINWQKHPSNNNPQPVIACSNPNGSYCTGQSSVFYKDNQFWHYFTNNKNPNGGSDWYVYLSTSTDGINFTPANNGQRVFGGNYGQNSVDVKYNPHLGLYFMVYGEVLDDLINWTISQDGLTWLAHDEKRRIDTSNECNHNPGVLGSATGTMVNETIVYFGAGRKRSGGSNCMDRDISTWNIDAATVELAPSGPSLFAGVNQIFWSESKESRASQFLTVLEQSCDLSTAKSVSQTQGSWWTSFVKDFGGDDFALNAARQYLLGLNRSCQWRPLFLVNPSSGYGNQQIFTTTIKPTSGGVENIKEVYFRLDEIYPLPERTPVAFSAAVKKDPNGHYRFYGLRWLGGEDPNDVVSYNILDWRNYLWDVGGFLPGENKKIFINRNRHSTDYRLQDNNKYINNSIAVLDVQNSEIHQDLTSGALVIKWPVEFFQPEFNQGAGLYGRAGSTDRKKLKIFLSSVDNQLNQAREIGEWIVGSPDNSALKLLTSTKSGNKYIVKTSFSDAAGINGIESAILWLDEIDPHASRSDVASYLVAKKEPDQSYAFYGLRYDRQSRETCPEAEIVQTDVSCYKNYQWDIGPVSSGEDKKIYLNRSRTSSLIIQEDSFAVFHAQEAKIITDSANELMVEWVFEFLPNFGNRQVKVYLSGTNSSGYNRWAEKGELSINNPPSDHGRIAIAPNQKYFQFTDGRFYSMQGINRLNIHRQLTEEQIDAYLAKMAAYQMNYLRVWYFGLPEQNVMLAKLFELAERHGVYINLTLFHETFLENLAEEFGEAPDFSASKERIDLAVERFGDKKALFAWDICNDCQMSRSQQEVEQWLNVVEPYLRQKDNNRHPILLQINTGRSFQEANYTHLLDNIDALSVRSYAEDPTTVAQELSARIKRELVSRKPVYIGEFRRLNHGYRQLEPETSLGTLYGLWTGLAGGAAGQHPWTHNFAPELVDKYPAYPLLSEREFTYFQAVAKVFPLLQLPNFDFQRVDEQIISSVPLQIIASFADNRLIAYLINPNPSSLIQPRLEINVAFTGGSYQAIFIQPETGEAIETREVSLPGAAVTPSFTTSLVLLIRPD